MTGIKPHRIIDHIVYCVEDLDCAMNWFEGLSGVRPEFGGYHQQKGTKNALVSLGDQRYLEFLAIDTDNQQIQEPRWMGIDLICKSQITRWAIKSEDLNFDSNIITQFDNELGQIAGGQRKTENGKVLKWEMIMPLTEPCVDLIPFMIDWSASEVHPANQVQAKVDFLSLQFVHPDPLPIVQVFEELGLDYGVSEGLKSGIFLKINTPQGVVEL